MAEYTVCLTMVVSAVVTVDADDPDAAIDAAYHSPEMPGTMGHQAFGDALVDESEWEPTSVSDAAGEEVWSEDGVRADAVDRVRRFVDAYSAAKEGLDAERVATFDDHRLLLSDLRVLIGGAE